LLLSLNDLMPLDVGHILFKFIIMFCGIDNIP